MHRLLLTILGFVMLSGTLTGCDKAVEDAKEDFVISLITNNLWVVTQFTEGSSNLTADFAPYEFKFNRDETVLGRRTGQPDAQGTWRGDAGSMTITSSFPNGPNPLNKLTGVWNITKTTLSSVKATRTNNGVVYNLDLSKK
jgi:hypothetical protein